MIKFCFRNESTQGLDQIRFLQVNTKSLETEVLILWVLIPVSVFLGIYCVTMCITYYYLVRNLLDTTNLKI